MLSIGKLGAGAQVYYLATVAPGVEDYYVGRGEAPGRWLGALAHELELDGRVDGEQLRAVLEGVDPVTGVPLGRTRSDRVPGFDLTFRAPKSVSLLFGLGGFETAREVRAAHDAAVDAALGYLERSACWTRRGTNGVEQIRGRGFVAAGFRHRTSRAGDPHLHTHVLVANLTRTDNGRWSTLDARHLYLHAKTAGYLYEAHLRVELTRRLGVEWGPVHNGIADVNGISKAVLRAFSTRRAEIEAEMASRGVTSARAAEVSALDTRQAKDYQVDPLAMIEHWRQQARELGLDQDTLDTVLHRAEPAPLGSPEVRQGIDRLIGSDGLTAHASSFDRRDVLRAWCDQLVAGADVEEIEALGDRTISEPSVVALRANASAHLRTRGRGRRIEGPDLGASYSTADLLALERRLVDHATARREDGVGMVNEDVVLAALASRPEISDDQAEMVVRLTTSGRGVDVVVAPAGTGKTFALDAARDAWQRQGHHVIGTALAARAAAELETTAGIRSHTIASLLADLDHPQHGGLAPGTVLVVDEAGMVGTRALGRVLAHADKARAKVVLVGDPRQLPEIQAGGLLRGLGERLEPIRLKHNRRQHDPWERAALAAMRRGDVDRALAAYDAHERIISRPTATATRDAMVADWWVASLRHQQVLMVAARWFDVDDLNARARQHLNAAGMVSGPTLEIDGRPYQTGDRVMTLRNQRRLGVRNGTLATVAHVDPDEGTLTIHTDRGTSHVLPAAYLDAGHLRHAYATTIHKAQGLTVDQALVLGNDSLYQEAAYVALSRGRAENRLYLVASSDEPEQHAPAPQRDAMDSLAAALRVSHAQQLAIDHGVDRLALHHRLARLYHELPRLQRIAGAAPNDPTADINALQLSRADLQYALDAQRERLETLTARRPLRHRREHDAERLVTAQAVERLTTQIEQTELALTRAHERRDEPVAFLAEHQDDLVRLPQVECEIEVLLTRLVDEYRSTPPAYLQVLGPCPTVGNAQRHWTAAATTVEDYRRRRGVNDPRRPFGALDRSNREQQRARERVDQALERIAPQRHPEPVGIELGL